MKHVIRLLDLMSEAMETMTNNNVEGRVDEQGGDIDWDFEYQGRSVRRGAGGRGWLIVRSRGAAGDVGEEDTILEFSSLEAVKQYIDLSEEH